MVLMCILAAAQTAPPAVVTVAQGQMSGVAETRELLVRSESEWKTWWPKHAGNDAEPLPAVDFQREIVAAVFLGSRPTGGYAVRITGTRRDGDALIIQYAVREPGRDEFVTQAFTAPFHIVRLPRHDGPVRFERATPAAR